MVRATTHLKRKTASSAMGIESRTGTTFQNSSKDAVLSPLKLTRVTERGQALNNFQASNFNSYGGATHWETTSPYPQKRAAWKL